jgi:hypothetical protein
MSNPSNLYAEKIYSEHPLVLWALDDQADYVSLISEADRDIETEWSVTGGTATEATISNEPFPNSITTSISGTVPVGPTGTILCVSPGLVNFSDLNSELGTFSVGGYFYSNSPYLSSVSIGYEYTDTTTSLVVQKLKTFPTTIFGNWAFVSETFEIPDESTDLRAVVKIVTNTGGVTSGDYQFYINGITVGQWAEDFNATSLGVTPQTFPSDISLTTSSQVIPANSYGISSDEAYYLIDQNAFVAKNSSVPMVFGASGVTTLTPNSNGNPSLIFPGKGFLNELGRYKEYTVEFWARISCDSVNPKRIFGPISSEDGLYVEGGFLTLVVGTEFRSHFVGEWVRPMLIHIRSIRNSVSVLLNGEEVISFSVDTEALDLPQPEYLLKSQDWLGFYAYSDVTPIEIDCVAIYPYQVPTTVAKRRWVYGQGVLSPEGINSAYGGTSAFIDYPFAGYTSNYNYPDFGSWQQGTFDNLVTTNTALTTPEYSLPEIFLDSKTINEFYLDNQEIQEVASGVEVPNKFITFRPNNDWNSINPYINFTRFNILADEIHSIYGVFQINEDDASDQILFKIYNTLNGNSFSIRKDGPDIDYYLTYNGLEQEFYSLPEFPVGEPIAIGVNLQTVINSFGGDIASFFGERNGLKMYVGGDESGTLTFTGNIYTVGLSTSFNASEVANHFNDEGFCLFDSAQELIDHTASYTLLPTEAYGKFFLDIGVSGYWQDYMPLSYFAKFVTNDVGNQFYDLDFLQFNIGYPGPSSSSQSEEVAESWTYGQLKSQFEHPEQKTYYQFDNFLFTGWSNYEDIEQKSVKFYQYDTDNASIRSYVTFQYVSEGANAPQTSFDRVESAKSTRIVDIDEHPLWATTKFEVVDNTIIYPTKTIDFNELAIVYHLEFNIRNILTKPIALRRLELASQALSQNSFNPIGTRFSLNMFPYKRSGLYYDYKSKNPFSIYKGSTPYLYLNRKTGIEVRGTFDPQVSRGIAVPINQTSAANYRVSAAQVWMRYDDDLFPGTPTELFEIEYKGDTIKFYMVADSSKGSRARIFARSQNTGLDFNGLAYFWNGSLVREPVITKKEWGVLGIAFSTALNFDGYLGGINLTGPMLFNNIAYYQANNLQQVQSTLTRPWLQVETDGFTNFDWQYWLNNFTWEGVLVISASDLYGVNPQDVYKTYTGTNKIIIDDSEGMIFDAETLKIYANTTWQTTVKIPV